MELIRIRKRLTKEYREKDYETICLNRLQRLHFNEPENKIVIRLKTQTNLACKTFKISRLEALYHYKTALRNGNEQLCEYLSKIFVNNS